MALLRSMFDFDLRRVDAELREDVSQPRILRGGAHDPVRRPHQHRQADVAAVLQLELESAETADAVDGRRIEREDLRLGNLRVEGEVDCARARYEACTRDPMNSVAPGRLCVRPTA